MEIRCPLCTEEPAIFKSWQDYARHILSVHPEDKRSIWAEDALAAKDEVIIEEKKYRGKPIEQIPVSRRSTLPPIIRKQLEEEDKKYKAQAKEARAKNRKTKAEAEVKAKVKEAGGDSNAEKSKGDKGRSKKGNAKGKQE